MDARTRCLKILDLLQQQHKVEVKSLAEMFETSEMTIRRDLSILTQQYNIIRTHGGAKLAQDSVVRTISFDENKIENKEQKKAIAKLAASKIGYKQKIFIDSGSTTRQMTRFLSDSSKAIIVTNSISIADAVLQYANLSVIMLGGEILPIAKCSFGDTAEEQVKTHQFDVAFLGTAAIGADGNLYDGYSLEARLKGTILKSAKKICLLADSSKFNCYDVHKFGALNEIDMLITDFNLSKEAKSILEKYKINVFYV